MIVVSNVRTKSDMPCTRVRLLLLISVVFAVSLGLGVIIGYFSHPSSSSSSSSSASTKPCDGVCLGADVPNKIIEDATEGITEKIIALMNADNIRNNLE